MFDFVNAGISYVLLLLFVVLSDSVFLKAEEDIYPKTKSPINGYMLATVNIRQNHLRQPKSLREHERVVLIDQNRRIIATGPVSSKFNFIVSDYYRFFPTGFWNQKENTVALVNSARIWSRVDFFRYQNSRLEEIPRPKFPLSKYIPDFITTTRYYENFEMWIDEKTCEIRLSGYAQTGKNYRGEQDDKKCDYFPFEAKVILDVSGNNAKILSMVVNLNP